MQGWETALLDLFGYSTEGISAWRLSAHLYEILATFLEIEVDSSIKVPLKLY